MSTQGLPHEVERIAWNFLADVIEGGGSKETAIDGWKIAAKREDVLGFADVEISKGGARHEAGYLMLLNPDLDASSARKYRNWANDEKRRLVAE